MTITDTDRIEFIANKCHVIELVGEGFCYFKDDDVSLKEAIDNAILKERENEADKK
jgi:hypothetical protein